jgi:hypothetical protein
VIVKLPRMTYEWLRKPFDLNEGCFFDEKVLRTIGMTQVDSDNKSRSIGLKLIDYQTYKRE